jgi:hypothetical protein
MIDKLCNMHFPFADETYKILKRIFKLEMSASYVLQKTA